MPCVRRMTSPLTSTPPRARSPTLRATFHAIPMTNPVWLTLNGGASLIRRGGDAYAAAEDRSDVGGVVGATVGFRLGSMLSFYLAAEDYPERRPARVRVR